MATTADTEPVRVVLRLRTLGPSGLNPSQIKVIDRLQTLSEGEDSPVIELDVDVWKASRGLTQIADRDLEDTRETVAEFIQWADAHGYTLQPAFEWRPADSETDGERQQARIVPPLISLAVYNGTGEHLQAVYPHVNGEDVQTIHDGIEALESMTGPGDVEQSQDEHNKQEDLVPPQ